jgi:prepilin-type N-terminal cleavage/methylation domain-containing protein
VSPISHSARLPSNKRNTGFTILEMLIALAIFGTMLTAAFMIFSSGLQTKRSEDLKLGLQQNVRAAMQIISQDLRSAGVMHLYNQSPCNNVCSNNTQVAILALTGTNTAIASTPGTTPNATQTAVCDASQFKKGDIAVRYNGTSIATNSSNVVTSAINTGFNTSQVLQLSSAPTERSAPKAACTATSNDTLFHAQQNVSGTIANDGQSYVFKANLLTYVVRPDPFDSSRTALYQLSGLGDTTTTPVTAPDSAPVAYDIKSLKISYGIRFNPTALSASRLVFYDTLEDAVTVQGTASTSNVPGVAGKTYIAGLVTAVRVTLTGESANNLPNTSKKATFTLSETVDLRN